MFESWFTAVMTVEFPPVITVIIEVLIIAPMVYAALVMCAKALREPYEKPEVARVWAEPHPSTRVDMPAPYAVRRPE